ncbi:MAG TPA: hypothetical protein VJT13_11610 [Xanthobacteraceae bacterium]|nr:hypothetical protein [Xanthobacteraceae bacterium]
MIEALGTPFELIALELLNGQPQRLDLRLRRSESNASPAFNTSGRIATALYLFRDEPQRVRDFLAARAAVAHLAYRARDDSEIPRRPIDVSAASNRGGGLSL